MFLFGKMSKIKYRKARPQPPRHYWLDADCCWFCKDRNGCSNCKVIKEYIHFNDKGKRRRDKQLLRKYPGVAE